MGLMFSSVFLGVAETAQQDQFEIQPADDKPVTLYAFYNTQETEVGDAAEEQIPQDIVRGHTTSGSVGGTNPTPRPTDRNNATAAGAVVEINNTTKATVGTTHTLHRENMNVRNGLYYTPIPELRKSASKGDTTLVVGRTQATPADAVTMDGVAYFEEN